MYFVAKIYLGIFSKIYASLDFKKSSTVRQYIAQYGRVMRLWK